MPSRSHLIGVSQQLSGSGNDLLQVFRLAQGRFGEGCADKNGKTAFTRMDLSVDPVQGCG